MVARCFVMSVAWKNNIPDFKCASVSHIKINGFKSSGFSRSLRAQCATGSTSFDNQLSCWTTLVSLMNEELLQSVPPSASGYRTQNSYMWHAEPPCKETPFLSDHNMYSCRVQGSRKAHKSNLPGLFALPCNFGGLHLSAGGSLDW